jgi:hypothetical protein
MVFGDGKLPGSPITKRLWFGGSNKFSCSGNRIRERPFFLQLLPKDAARAAFRADRALFRAPPLANSHLPLCESRGPCHRCAQPTGMAQKAIWRP